MWKPILSFMKMRRVRKMRAQQQGGVHNGSAQRQNPYFHRERKPSITRVIPESVRGWARTDGWAIAGIVILVLVTGWYFGLHTQKFVVSDITIEGVQFMKVDDVRAAVDQYTSSKVVGVFARNTYWTLSAKSLELSLQDTLSHNYALEGVAAVKSFPNHLKVTVRERVPQVSWVTQSDDGQDHYYTVDREGRVAQALGGSGDALPEFPLVRDQNHKTIDVGAQVVSAEYLDFLLKMNDQFPEATGLQIASYIFPNVECQQKQYVTEKILEDEILDSQSEEFRDKKRTIQEKFQKGLLTVDQSLDALEQIKQEELEKLGEGTNTNAQQGVFQWQAVYVPTDCDYTVVAHDVYIVTTEESGGFTVYMDSTVDPIIQMQNLSSVLESTIADRTTIHYIDARFIDRVYYQ